MLPVWRLQYHVPPKSKKEIPTSKHIKTNCFGGNDGTMFRDQKLPGSMARAASLGRVGYLATADSPRTDGTSPQNCETGPKWLRRRQCCSPCGETWWIVIICQREDIRSDKECDSSRWKNKDMENLNIWSLPETFIPSHKSKNWVAPSIEARICFCSYPKYPSCCMGSVKIPKFAPCSEHATKVHKTYEKIIDSWALKTAHLT